jgi:hypothetical protein
MFSYVANGGVLGGTNLSPPSINNPQVIIVMDRSLVKFFET